MNVTCHDFRLALVWTRGHLEILRHPQAESQLRFLGRRLEYQTVFEQTVAGQAAPWGLETPWRFPPGEPFWSHYLEGTRLPDVTAARAWRAQIPFRRQLSVTVTAPWWPGRIVFHGFFYPHGVALVGDATYRGSMPLDDAVDLVTRFSGEKLTLRTEDGAESRLDLQGLADALLGQLSDVFLDGKVGGTTLPGAPFTVFTLVSGDVEGAVTAPADGSPLHHALDGLATLDPQWRNASPPSLKDSTLELGRSYTGHLVYAARRGRAVWFPHNFVPGPAKSTTLSDYHRGLSLLSLQVESLCRVLADSAAEHAEKKSLTSFHEDYACDVAKLVGRLYGNPRPFPPDGPWYSSSVAHHVDAGGHRDAIDKVRVDVCRVPALHTPATG